MPGTLDAHGAEVHRQHIERGFRAALHRGRHQRREAVHALGLHGFDQQGPRRTAREGFDHGRWQCIDKARIPTQPLNYMADAVQAKIQCSGCPQHAHRTEHRHQVWQQVFRHVEAFLGPFDKRFVDLDLAQRTDHQKQHDQAEQREVAQDRRQAGQRRGRQGRQQRHEAAQDQRARHQVRQHHRVPQAQALHNGHREQADQGRGAGGQQDRQEYQGRVRCPLLGAVHKDGDRQQGQGRGVEYQEQDLRIARAGRARVELLQGPHGLEADGRGSVIQPKAIGGEVQGDKAQCRMTGRDFRHQALEQRPQRLAQPVDDAGFFGNAQKTQP